MKLYETPNGVFLNPMQIIGAFSARKGEERKTVVFYNRIKEQMHYKHKTWYRKKWKVESSSYYQDFVVLDKPVEQVVDEINECMNNLKTN